MHEQGLAIDFMWDGSMISSHSNAAWQWLNANAATYGFYNLPVEPWHWSVNGH
jgi:D-alanyl-D-alanine carboxypeptidase